MSMGWILKGEREQADKRELVDVIDKQGAVGRVEPVLPQLVVPRHCGVGLVHVPRHHRAHHASTRQEQEVPRQEAEEARATPTTTTAEDEHDKDDENNGAQQQVRLNIIQLEI